MHAKSSDAVPDPAALSGLLRISEIYESIQGEGLLSGTRSIFVRTSGCNLRCWFCDTPFTSWRPEGDHLQVGEILRQVSGYSCEHVVLTGGEPMIFQSIGQLTGQLRRSGYHLTIETAGTLWRDVQCDLWSISPKLPGSAPDSQHGSWQALHHRRRFRPEVVRRMMQQPYQLKFVVDSPKDAEEVLEYLKLLGDHDPQRVLLMPQGTDTATLDRQAEWLVPWCQEHQVRFCPRQHIYWFGNRRGT
jgi:7-carboxy-7-deazaguanine synthase